MRFTEFRFVSFLDHCLAVNDRVYLKQRLAPPVMPDKAVEVFLYVTRLGKEPLPGDVHLDYGKHELLALNLHLPYRLDDIFPFTYDIHQVTGRFYAFSGQFRYVPAYFFISIARAHDLLYYLGSRSVHCRGGLADKVHELFLVQEYAAIYILQFPLFFLYLVDKVAQLEYEFVPFREELVLAFFYVLGKLLVLAVAVYVAFLDAFPHLFDYLLYYGLGTYVFAGPCRILFHRSKHILEYLYTFRMGFGVFFEHPVLKRPEPHPHARTTAPTHAAPELYIRSGKLVEIRGYTEKAAYPRGFGRKFYVYTPSAEVGDYGYLTRAAGSLLNTFYVRVRRGRHKLDVIQLVLLINSKIVVVLTELPLRFFVKDLYRDILAQAIPYQSGHFLGFKVVRHLYQDRPFIFMLVLPHDDTEHRFYLLGPCGVYLRVFFFPAAFKDHLVYTRFFLRIKVAIRFIELPYRHLVAQAPQYINRFQLVQLPHGIPVARSGNTAERLYERLLQKTRQGPPGNYNSLRLDLKTFLGFYGRVKTVR